MNQRPIKKLLDNSLFKEFSLFSSSTLFFQVSRVLVELTAAKLLGPALWGVWYILNLTIAYRGIFDLGITNGMNREVPINLGKGEKDKAVYLQNITFSSVIGSSIVASITLIIVASFIQDRTLQRAVILLIPLFIITQFYYLVNASLKANTLFKYVSQKQFIFSFIFPLVALPLTFYLGLEGFIVGFSLALLLSVIYIYLRSPIDYRFRFNRKDIINLVRIGFPIMAVGIAYTFLNTADRWIIGIFLGAESLGFYSMAIIVFGGMTLFPKVISQQLYPRMAHDWGKLKSVDNLRSWSGKQTRYTAYLVIPLLIVVIIVFPWIIKTFLSEYEPGVVPMIIIIFGTLFMPLSAGWGNVLNIIDKQVYYLSIIIFAIIMNIVLNYLLVIAGYGINGVAFGTALTFALYNLSIMVVGKYFLKRI